MKLNVGDYKKSYKNVFKEREKKAKTFNIYGQKYFRQLKEAVLSSSLEIIKICRIIVQLRVFGEKRLTIFTNIKCVLM